MLQHLIDHPGNAAATRGLEESSVAPGKAANRGEALPALRTRQYEAGARFVFDPHWRLILAAFDISKPYFEIDLMDGQPIRPNLPTYLTNQEADALLRLSPRTLEKQRVIGGGPSFRKFGRRVPYALEDLESLGRQEDVRQHRLGQMKRAGIRRLLQTGAGGRTRTDMYCYGGF